MEIVTQGAPARRPGDAPASTAGWALVKVERFSRARVFMAMALHWFSPPVYVTTGKLAERYAVTNIERAAEYLLSWRDRGMGPDWQKAVRACTAALKSEGGTEEARSSFEAAARECGKQI